MGEFIHQSFGYILEQRQAASHVAIQRGITDRHFAFVAGADQQMAVAVGQRHGQQTAQARLHIFRRGGAGQGRSPVGLQVGAVQHVLQRAHGGSQRDFQARDIQPPRKFQGIGQCFVGGHRGGHRHSEHPVWPQGIHRNGGHERGVHTSGECHHCARKLVFLHIIAQAHLQGRISAGHGGRQRSHCAGHRLPTAIFPGQIHQQHFLAEQGRARGNRAIRRHGDAAAGKNQPFRAARQISHQDRRAGGLRKLAGAFVQRCDPFMTIRLRRQLEHHLARPRRGTANPHPHPDAFHLMHQRCRRRHEPLAFGKLDAVVQYSFSGHS